MRSDRDEAHASEDRILIHAPFGRDGLVMSEVLDGAAIQSVVCDSTEELYAALEAGAAAAVIAVDTVSPDDLKRLSNVLSKQEAWSDIPLIILYPGRDAAAIEGMLLSELGPVGNLNTLERPLGINALLNAVRLALRARRRQYQARAYMRQLEETKESLAKLSNEAVQANEAKSRFLAAASHDLRQPFQAMRLFHQVVADCVDGTPASVAAARLGEAITSGEDLLNSLLDLSTLDAGVTKVDVTDVGLDEVFLTVANDLGPTAVLKGLELRVLPCTVTVRSDPVLLKRVVRNLVVNAIRYTTHGKVLLGCRRRADDVLVQVWDTGIGIDPTKLGKIFEDFYQVNNQARDRSQGIGLGLSIVERMARLLDHEVSVESAPGRGSVFSIRVPRGGSTFGA